ncbi:MAG: polysaccharide deacetylase family protein [Bacteroidetes bacterium]|nr:polysaccharide deacetylase family protein [Bacteroidota bacterium]
MHYQKQLHPLTHLIKAALGNLLFPITGFPQRSGDLLVLNLHSTPLSSIQSLRALITFLSRHYTLQPASYLEEHYSGASMEGNKKPSVVFTFDDGLRNNLHAAALLEEFGISGLFFVVPDFFLSEENAQETYYRTHIRRIINPHYDHLPEDFCAMRSEELRGLKQRGHVIGSHSMSHTMDKKQDEAQLQREIVASKEVIDRLLEQETTHFCAPFNSLQSVSPRAMELIAAHYRYFHSTFPGSNLEDKNPMFVRRVNVEAFWLKGAVKFACSGSEWKRWKQDAEAFINLGKNT